MQLLIIINTCEVFFKRITFFLYNFWCVTISIAYISIDLYLYRYKFWGRNGKQQMRQTSRSFFSQELCFCRISIYSFWKTLEYSGIATFAWRADTAIFWKVVKTHALHTAAPYAYYSSHWTCSRPMASSKSIHYSRLEAEQLNSLTCQNGTEAFRHQTSEQL